MLISQITGIQTDYNLEDLFEIEDGISGVSKKGTLENFLLTALAKIPVTWIPVIYENSWVDYGAAQKTEYYKDVSGNVHLRIACKSGVAAQMCTLPVGYRPEVNHYRPIYTTGAITNCPAVFIITTGVIAFANYSNARCEMGEIIYRAA